MYNSWHIFNRRELHVDTQIKSYFKNKRYANLEYLSNEYAWEEDPNNLGLYFFLLDLKGEDTSKAFNQILDRMEGQVQSYRYLGGVARELFTEPYERNVAAYYYKEALKYDDSDTETLWDLFYLTYDNFYFLTAIKADYEASSFKNISNNLFRTYVGHLVEAKFDKVDWKKLKEICLDENVSHYHELLLICCFYLEDFDSGINLMDEIDWVSKKIIDLYLDKECIDFEYALQKLNYLDRFSYLEGDVKRLYEEAKKESEKGNANPTKEALIQYAFRAGEYYDVISLVEEVMKNSNIRHTSNVQRLYHILSSLYLGMEINEEYEIVVNKQNFFREGTNGSNCLPLYLSYLVLRNIKVLETYLGEKDNLHEISQWGLYQEIEEYLSCGELVNHYIYESLVDQFESLKNRWDTHVNNIELEKLSIDASLSESNRTELAYRLITANMHDEAISQLSKLEPSMSVSNMLGVCCESQGKIDSALNHFESAINIMKSSGELNDVIISNYLSCLNKSNHSIQESLYYEYIDDFNSSIANRFRYDLFTPSNRKSLFKYYPFNQFTLDALVNSYFYLASSEQLNDPIELPYESLSSDKDNVHLKPNFRLASFSNNENSMLMWSHYAQNHTGLMVEYCFKGELPKGVGIEKVSYSHTTKRYKEKERYLFNQYMLTKNVDWSYEKEVRLFAYKRDKVYYDTATYPNRAGDKANVYISSITVGYKFPESTIKLIKNIIASLNESREENLPKIELRKAKLSVNNFFELEYEVID